VPVPVLAEAERLPAAEPVFLPPALLLPAADLPEALADEPEDVFPDAEALPEVVPDEAFLLPLPADAFPFAPEEAEPEADARVLEEPEPLALLLEALVAAVTVLSLSSL